MSNDNPFLSKLSELRDNIGRLVGLNDNEYDTSGFSGNGIMDRIQNLQGVLRSALGGNDNSSGSRLSGSVGRGGTNNSADVRTVQTLLNQKGAGLSVDGAYGNNTYNAIVNFQRSLGFSSPDGLIEVGGQTWKALSGSGSSTAPSGNSGSGISGSVGQGGTNNNADVRRIQELLNAKGASLSVDGQIGPNTINAIRSFQSNNGITADGLIEPGRGTWKALTGSGNSNDNNGGIGGVIGGIQDAVGGILGGGNLSGSVGQGGDNNSDDVRRVQDLLNKKGASLTVDGQIGSNTINAIRGFQSANGIPADGVISPGRNTWKALTGNGKDIGSSTGNTGTNNGGSNPAPVRPTGSYSYHDHPNWQNVRLEYQPGSRTAHQLNPTAERLLRSVTAEAGLDYVLVTSTKRTFADQAYITLTQVTESEAFQWYGYAVSDQARFYRHKRELANGKDPEAVYAEYGDYIRRVAGEGASNHIPGYAIDVSMSGLGAFNAGAGRLVPIRGSGVRTVFPEPGRTHIEFTFVVV